MNPEEYSNLAKVEQQHWFYAGKRKIVRHWINRCHPLKPADLLADCGAGTGIFADEMRGACRVIAVDDYEESLELLCARIGKENVRKGSCTALPLADDSVDVLTALDVIEHVQDDQAALREFLRVTRPGGLIVITVPALMALWSDWDVTLRHFRRYDRPALLKIIPPGLEVRHINYVNVAVLPVVYFIRKFRALKQRLGFASTARSEDRIPPQWLNRILERVFLRLACQTGVRFPAGVGLILVLQKIDRPRSPSSSLV
ncbi:MAG TPA: class I SAM-dependent methyltransferase [Candidatus Acidoferrales bacterium]|jgi:ubiquinone/menaquinone biosynthesis C-methylase UbiE|nr:class I SAM-dependent methyltransferase [Candidatus Acidoferrales bacterium]